MVEIEFLSQIKARQRGRELSTELTNISANLYDLIEKEEQNKVGYSVLKMDAKNGFQDVSISGQKKRSSWPTNGTGEH